MTFSVEQLRALLESGPKPECAALTPCELLDADPARGWVKIQFAAQPAFRNHFGNIQAGFAAAMLDVPISVAGFLKTGKWLPTVELKCSYLSPAPVAICIGEGLVLKAGKRLAFLEGRLLSPDGTLAVHATATVSIPAD